MSDSKPTPFRTPNQALEQQLSQRIGITFNDPLRLRLALTHRSVIHEWTQHGMSNVILQSNERLEFLGDAVLGFVTAERLYRALPNADEGTLTRTRVGLVRSETLVKWARSLGVEKAVYLGTGETITDSVRDRILAGTMEAIIGAIYLDQGTDAAATFINDFLDSHDDIFDTDEAITNPKGRLQEVVQEHKLDQPVYEIVAEDGPDHARVFTVHVVVNNHHIGTGTGRSKREAQQVAARQALLAIDDNESLLTSKE